MTRYVGGKHPDLAVRDLASRAGVLATDAARGFALLEKAGLVDHQHRIGGAKRLDHIVAHDVAQPVRIPPPAAKDRLLPPRPRIARREASRVFRRLLSVRRSCHEPDKEQVFT